MWYRNRLMYEVHNVVKGLYLFFKMRVIIFTDLMLTKISKALDSITVNWYCWKIAVRLTVSWFLFNHCVFNTLFVQSAVTLMCECAKRMISLNTRIRYYVFGEQTIVRNKSSSTKLKNCKVKGKFINYSLWHFLSGNSPNRQLNFEEWFALK